MAFQRIRIKNTNVAGKVPGADKLDTAELCVNLKDHKLFSKDADGDVFELGGGSASVPGGPTPPGSGNSIGDLFFDTTNEILLYWNGTEWLPVTGDGYVKLDDNGTTQSIIGGGGIDLVGPLDVGEEVRINTTENLPREGLMVNGDIHHNAGNYAIRLYNEEQFLGSNAYTYISRGSSGEIEIAEQGGWGGKYLFSARNAFISISNDNNNGYPVPIAGGTAVVHVYNGLNTQFGTDTAQLGNVAPLNDWSCYPARA